MKPSAGNPIDQARAKLIWGEPADTVRTYLISNGLSDAEADLKIAEFSAERNTDIQKIGIKKIVIGGALSCIAVFYFISICISGHAGTNYRSAKGMAIITLAGFYGMWKLIDGIVYLVRPQSETKSITEIAE